MKKYYPISTYLISVSRGKWKAFMSIFKHELTSNRNKKKVKQQSVVLTDRKLQKRPTCKFIHKCCPCDLCAQRCASHTCPTIAGLDNTASIKPLYNYNTATIPPQYSLNVQQLADCVASAIDVCTICLSIAEIHLE